MGINDKYSNFQTHYIYRYEAYKIGKALYLEIPVQNLTSPTFSLENDTLNIYIDENKHVIKIKNLSPQIIDFINNGSCYLREIIQTNLKKKIYIIKTK